jgi:hypothetical protein
MEKETKEWLMGMLAFLALAAISLAIFILTGCVQQQPFQTTMSQPESGWVLGGDHVYWDNGKGARITCTPVVATELITQHTFCNFTYTNETPRTFNLTFVFDLQSEGRDVLLLRNVTELQSVPTQGRVDYEITLYGLVANSSSSSPCDFGDLQNFYRRRLYYANGTNLTGCFNKWVKDGDNYTFNYQLNGTVYVEQNVTVEKFVSIKHKFSAMEYNGKKLYTINDVEFENPTNYQTGFVYDIPAGSSGKFDVVVHTGSPSDVIEGTGNIVLKLDPWWNLTWNYTMPIYINTTVESNLTNFPARVSLNTSNTTLWNTTTCTNVRFVDADGATLLNYNLDTNNASFCGNATNNATFWVKGNYTGNVSTTIYAYLGNVNATSGENATDVWSEYTTVMHGDTFTDLMLRNNFSASGTVSITDNQSKCKVGLCFSFDTTSSYLTSTNYGGLPNRANNSTTTIWGYNANLGATMRSLYIIGGGGINLARIAWSNSTIINVENWGSTISATLSDTTARNTPKFYAMRYNGTHYTVSNGTASTNTSGTLATSPSGHAFNIGHADAAGQYWATDGAGAALDEFRLTNFSRSDDWLKAEYLQSSSTGAVTAANLTTIPVISTTLGNGINSILFNASTFISKNVSASNQSVATALFFVNCTMNCNTTTNITCNQSPAITGFSVKCATSYNASAATPCNASAPVLFNLSAANNSSVWCWADFYFPATKSANLNITFGGG